MLKDLSFDEIQTYFKELDAKENSKFLKAQLYGMAKREVERMEKENEIESTYGNDARKHVKSVIIIDDELSIIKASEKFNGTTVDMYFPVVNMKKYNCAYGTLDSAIVHGIAIKHNRKNYGDAATELTGC